MILIGHDMGLMAQFVDRLGVMYAGKLVEVGADRRRSSREPLHPYTAAADRQPAVARAEGRPCRASPACRRRCSTCRPAARSIRAARMAFERCRGRASRRCCERATARAGSPATCRRDGRADDRAARGATTSPRRFGGGLLDKRRARSRCDDFSLAIDAEPPSITAVVGESGSGKTTLARLLLGLADADQRRGALPGHGSAQALRRRERRAVPARRPGDLPGPVRGLQPVLQSRSRAGRRRSASSAWPTTRRRGASADRGGAARRSACGPRRRSAAIPHQLQRRPAPARSWSRARCCCSRADHRRRAGLDGRRLAARDDPGEPAQAEPTSSASRSSTSRTT